jgi:HlyD family secretion protein
MPSEEKTYHVDEIVGAPPQGIIFWGSTMIFSLFVLIFILSFFIRYPDTISNEIVITSENPPIEIISKNSGEINLFVNDQESVRKGQVLAIIENTVDYQDLSILKEKLIAFRIDSLNEFEQMHSNVLKIDTLLNYHFRLGELEIAFSEFNKSLKEFIFYSDIGYHSKKNNVVNQKINKYYRLKQNLQNQLTNKQKEFGLVKINYERQKKLLKSGAISSLEEEKFQMELLNKLNEIENLKSNIINTDIQIYELKNLALENDFDLKDNSEKFKVSLIKSYNTLISRIDVWEEKNVLTSPIKGKVSFFEYRSNKQFVEEGKVVMTVLPIEVSKLIGIMKIPSSKSGKVKIGQKTIVDLANYPHDEFGKIFGKIAKISLIPQDKMYYVEVDLPEGLITSYDIQLEFKQKLVGRGEIITEDLSLFQRIFNQFRKLME